MITLEEAKEKSVELSLEIEKISIFRINYFDLEQWFKKIFNKELSFVATMCCNNNSSHEFDVDGKTFSKQKEAEEFIYGNRKYAPNYDIESVLNVLCRDGFLNPGQYIISVSW